MGRPHFSVLGFPVRIETNAVLVAGYIAFRVGAYAVVLIAVFFFSVLLHELGHALAFRRYGCSSGITIHGMGGTTASYDAHRLTNRQHVFVSLAGPLAQLVLLGLPALAAWFYFGPYGQTGQFIRVMMFINVGWAVVNLLPIYPMDGGQILYRLLQNRSLNDPWEATRAITTGVGAGVVVLAIWSGYTIGGLLIGYIVLRGAFGGPPGGRNNTVLDAASRARAAHLRQNVKGAGREATLAEAYGCLFGGSPTRLETLMGQLERGNHLSDLATLRAWQTSVDNPDSEPTGPPPDSRLYTAAMRALAESPESGIGPALEHAHDSPELFPAVALLHRSGRLEECVATMSDEAVAEIRESLVRGGLLQEQMAVGRILRLRREALAES